MVIITHMQVFIVFFVTVAIPILGYSPLQYDKNPPFKHRVITPSPLSPHHNTPPTSLTRSAFLASVLIQTIIPFAAPKKFINRSNAFEGGIGGLGKVKPETGVVFLDPDSTPNDIGDGSVSCELLSPSKKPVRISYKSPWPLLSSTSGIESRGLSDPESAFVSVANVPKGVVSAKDLTPTFYSESLFGSSGKFGAYGSPYDIKIKKIMGDSSSVAAGGNGNEKISSNSIVLVSFTTLTPGLRESERKAFVSSYVVDDGVFMLIAGTTALRFQKQEDLLRNVINSFLCVSAPQSNFRKTAA